MIPFNPNTTRFDLTNALALAQAASLAYGSKAIIEKTLRNDWGFSRCDFFDKDDTQAFIAGNDEVIIVAFRGTESIKDWLTDAQVRLVPYKKGRVHKGFYEAFSLSAAWLKKTAFDFDTRVQSLWVTGHSLGAALATLAVDSLIAQENLFTVSGLYTFGSPRVGDKRFAAGFDDQIKHRHWRFINNEDIVTRVPPRLLGYRDTGTVRYFDNKGLIHKDKIFFRKWLDNSESAEIRSLDRFKELKYQYPNGVEDHGMRYYIRNIQKNLAKEGTSGKAKKLTFKDYINS